MSLSIVCDRPDCRRPLRVKAELAGKRIKCPGCGHVMTVPGDAGDAGDVGAKPGVEARRDAPRKRRTAATPIKPRRRRRRSLAVAGLVLLALSAGLAFYFEWWPFRSGSGGPGGPGGAGTPAAGSFKPIAAAALKQHVHNVRVVIPGSIPGRDTLIKRIHTHYEPHGVKIVVGEVTEAAPLKEDAILTLTYDRRRVGNSLSHEVSYVWIDVAQAFVVTANSLQETTFGAFGTPLTFTETFMTSFAPPLFLRDLRSCLSSHSVADEGADFFVFRRSVVTDDGGHIVYAKSVTFPTEQERKLGKLPKWQLRVLDVKQNKIVARQACQGEELYLHGTMLCCYDRSSATGLEIRDAARLPELGAPSQLFAGKKVTKVAAAGRLLCAIVEERLHVLDPEKTPPRELSVDGEPTAPSSIWTGPGGLVWMREPVPKNEIRVGSLRLGKIDADGKFQLERKVSSVEMNEGEGINPAEAPAYALSDQWAASISPNDSSALRLYDLRSGKPKLVHKLDAVAGQDVALYEDLCVVLDNSAMRVFSIADPKGIQHVCDVPLGKKMPSQGVPIKDLSRLSFFLLGVQGRSAQMRLVQDRIVAQSSGIVIARSGGKPGLSSVAQVHQIDLGPLRASARQAARAPLPGVMREPAPLAALRKKHEQASQ